MAAKRPGKPQRREKPKKGKKRNMGTETGRLPGQRKKVNIILSEKQLVDRNRAVEVA